MTDRDFQKNDIVTIEITDMDEKGQGIGKAGGFTLFVKDTVPGDVAVVKLMKVKKNYGFAKLTEIITPSPDRIAPACPKAKACGGCQLQEMSYEAELRFKENKVKNNLVRLGGFPEEYIEKIKEPIVGMQASSLQDTQTVQNFEAEKNFAVEEKHSLAAREFYPYRYRNKAQYPIGLDKEGNPVAGFYAGHTHDIIANTDCLLGREVNQKILEIVLEFLKTEKIRPYDESTNKGLFRHVLIREGFQTGEIMVCLIINGKSFPKEEQLCERLTSEIPSIASIILNMNMEKTNVIMGNVTRVLWGKDTITDYLGGIKFEISARSFYQVNPVQAERIYSKALEYAALSGKENVWDLYCGIGTISLFLAKSAGNVYGVEVIPEAIEDAKENAAANGITNAEFFVGKAEEVLPEVYENEPGKSGKFHPDVIVVDPPRKGCDEKCLDTMLLMKPERIVYVSCDSATLARDLKVLCAQNYELKAWQAFDQFSRTVHVEVVALIERVLGWGE